MLLAISTFREMHLHAHELDTRQGIIDVRKVLFAELATVHIQNALGVRITSTRLPATGSRTPKVWECHRCGNYSM